MEYFRKAFYPTFASEIDNTSFGVVTVYVMMGFFYSEETNRLSCFITFCLILLVCAPSSSQDVFSNADSTIQYNYSLGELDIKINLQDTLDIRILDSIISALDTAINKLPPPSEIYGHDVFKDSVKIFQPLTIMKVPDTYVLGVNDEIAISIFGTSQYEGKFEIDTAGFIKPAQLPKIFLKGLSWSEAKLKLRRQYSRYFIFRAEQFAASVSAPRNIVVNVFGEVERPGSYSLVATNTAFNCLFAAGGIRKIGSVRKIGIYNGSSSRTLDLYKLMSDPRLQFGNYLEDNVLIQVPVAEKVVRISGGVKRPMKYELLEGEGLLELINYSGGLNANAISGIVQIERFRNDEKVLIDIDLRKLLEERENVSLYNGDVIIIRTADNKLNDVVYVEGAVLLEGAFSLANTPTINDLIGKAKLTERSRLDIGFLVRQNPDSTFKLVQLDLENIINDPGSSKNLELKAFDRLIVTDRSTYVENAHISVRGAVRKEIRIPFDPEESITLNQALLLSGGLLNATAEEGYIYRTNINDRQKLEYIKVNLKQAISDPASSSNIALQPFDRIIVLPSSRFSEIANVKLKGAVREEKVLQFDESLGLQDLLYIGGGFKPEASGRILVYRVNISNGESSAIDVIELNVDRDFNIVNGPSDFSLKPFDEVVVMTVADYELQSVVKLEGQVRYPGEYALISQNERLTSVVERAGGLTSEAFPEGTIIIRKKDYFTLDSLGLNVLNQNFTRLAARLDLATSNPSSPSNFILKDGDIISIPKRDNLVYINLTNTGGEYKMNAEGTPQIIGVTFHPGKNAKWYIENYAGGFGDKADIGSIRVEYPNGGIAGTRGKGIFRKIPKVTRGSTISVGQKSSIIGQRGGKMSGNYPNLKEGVIVNIGKDGVQEENINPNNF